MGINVKSELQRRITDINSDNDSNNNGLVPIISNIISYLDTQTPSMLLSTRIPDYNNYFNNLEGLCEELLFLTENYQNKNTIYNDCTTFVEFANSINVDELTTAQLINEFNNDIMNKISIINNIFLENEQYFVRLKMIMADLKIASLGTNNQDIGIYLSSRSVSSQNTISQLLNKFETEGKVGYSDQVQEELFNIKIPR